MQRVTFSKAVVERLKVVEGKRYTDYGDNECRYLRMRVGTTSKVWYYVRKISQKVKWTRLGDWPVMSVDVARKRHDVFSGQVALGMVPTVKAPAPKRISFGQMYREYMDEHMKPKRDSWRDDERRYDRYLAKWDGLKAISSTMVAELHREIGETAPVNANRVVELVSRIYRYRAKKEQSDILNPAAGVTKFKERSRKRFLRANELRAFFAAIAAEREAGLAWMKVMDSAELVEFSAELPANADHLDYFEVLLWTGQRPHVVQSMTWDEVDLAGKVWRLPVGRTKTEEEQVVVLGPALEVLQRRYESRDERKDWVFPSVRGKGHMRDPRKSFGKLLKRSGLKDVRMYDLRRTLGSWLAASGGNVREAMGILGHTTMAAAQVYMQLDTSPLERRHKLATDAMRRAIGDDTNET